MNNSNSNFITITKQGQIVYKKQELTIYSTFSLEIEIEIAAIQFNRITQVKEQTIQRESAVFK